MTDSSVDPEWNRVAGGSVHSVNDPQGDLIDDTEVWEYGEETSEARFVQRNDVSVFPGAQEYGSIWYTDDLYSWHDWQYYDPGSVSLVDHDYHQDYTGSNDLSFSLGYKSAVINWDYDSPDIHQFDDSKTDYGKWHWEYRPFGVTVGGSNSDVMSVGSEITSDSFPSSGDFLTFSDPKVKFYYDGGLNEDYYTDDSILQSFTY